MRYLVLPGLAVAILVAVMVAPGAPEAGPPETTTPAARPATPAARPPAPDALTGGEGARLYDRFCLACHGTFGDGKGPAAPWLWPRPRDFTRGEYKWRSTPIGAPPTDADLAAAIRHGVPGTSMHAFGAVLDDAQVAALIAVLRGFAPGAFATPAEPVALGAPPPVTDALVARGAEVYVSMGCNQCHGDGLAGDGPTGKALKSAEGGPGGPYDLAREPLRRPRPAAGAPGDRALEAIYRSIATGLSGTAMAGFGGAMPDADLWAVAAFIDARRYRGPLDRGRASTDTHPAAIAIDRDQRLARAGYWPGNGTEDEMRIFGRTITVQGDPPAGITPAQGSVDAEQCTRCHAKQRREWDGSLHASAGSPGLLAQFVGLDPHRGGFVESCQRCHNPLPEQLPVTRPGHTGGNDQTRAFAPNPFYDERLQKQGINCASCHVRDWRRYGPERVPDSKLLSLPGYPLTELAIYERSDFCLGCHQLPPRQAVNGKPLLNTYREWLEGPYMARGVQCQHCHMPNREHTWKGVHDPDTFRQGISLETLAGRAGSGTVSVRARVTNVGAGHYLPTTPTPAAWLIIELVDARGKPIAGARGEKRIGRHLEYRGGWKEIEDTRIPPGESLELAAAWKDGRVAEATHARVTVRVHPDDYYEGFYESRLAGKLDPEARRLFEEALATARANRYVALERLVPIR